MSEKKNSLAREKKSTEPFWPELVSAYHKFCERPDRFNTKPSFDGPAPRDMKAIIVEIRKRAEVKNIEWTLMVALKSWVLFLDTAYTCFPWLKDHWSLSNLNRQKDSIFFTITKNKKDARGTKANGGSDDTGGFEGDKANDEKDFGRL